MYRTDELLILPWELESIVSSFVTYHDAKVYVIRSLGETEIMSLAGMCLSYKECQGFRIQISSKINNFGSTKSENVINISVRNPVNFEGHFTEFQYGVYVPKESTEELKQAHLRAFTELRSDLRKLKISRVSLAHGISGTEFNKPMKATESAINFLQNGGRFAINAWGTLPARVFYIYRGLS